MAARSFTVSEANELIPWVESVFTRLDGHRQRWQEHHQQLQILDVLWDDRVTSSDNPDHDQYVQHRRGLEDHQSPILVLPRTRILALEAERTHAIRRDDHPGLLHLPAVQQVMTGSRSRDPIILEVMVSAGLPGYFIWALAPPVDEVDGALVWLPG